VYVHESGSTRVPAVPPPPRSLSWTTAASLAQAPAAPTQRRRWLHCGSPPTSPPSSLLFSITQRAFDTLRVGPPGPPMVGYLLLCSGPPGCSTLTTRTGPASLSWPAPALSPLSTRTPGPASSGPCMLLLAARGPTARARSKPNGRSCPAATHARVPGSQRACPRALSTRWVHWLCT